MTCSLSLINWLNNSHSHAHLTSSNLFYSDTCTGMPGTLVASIVCRNISIGMHSVLKLSVIQRSKCSDFN